MENARAELVERFFTGTGQSYDLVVRLCTLGCDVYWKRRLLAKVPPSQAILDLACGTGIVTFALAKRHPQARLVGVDVTEEYLQVARQKAQTRGVKAEFIHANAETVTLTGMFDCITSSYIPKYVDADVLLANITPHLQSGGVIVLHDFLYPQHPLPRALWHVYNRALNFLGRIFFPEWKEVFDNNLTELIVRSKWLDDFSTALRRHGYTNIEIERLTFGSAAIISAKKKKE
ncbi:MAG: class I SAM-dependent methyltransferase [candidate division KSB1 bacterium]|nr:class I SAM-dependent methyltransferase [candidate division KSB1 bacterium]MDZ7368627.1 class I SAM-dependent methyltransferase [candidate division KSB1 bacterium]MDZ7406337.1 class I SAM-dependent methyltransferase [candidate division KSB1 bacterium]